MRIFLLLSTLFLLFLKSESWWVTIPSASTGCGSWIETNFRWYNDPNTSGNLNYNPPKGTYGSNNIRMYFCTGEVTELPQGNYCIYQNRRNVNACPSGFLEGMRRQDDIDEEVSGTTENLPKIDVSFSGSYTTWYFCCRTTDTTGKVYWGSQRSQMPSKLVLMKKGSSCQPTYDRTVTEGYVEWDDENDANVNGKDGSLPEGTYFSDTRIYFCTYDASTGPYNPTSLDLLNRTYNSLSISWSGATNVNFYRVVLKSGSSIVLNTTYSSSVSSALIQSLSPSTTYSVQVFSIKTMSSTNITDPEGITQNFYTCANGYIGTTCSTAVCLGGCLNGKCVGPDTCNCTTGWTGTTCNECTIGYFPSNGNCVACPNCGQGKCNDGSSGNGQCACFPGYKTSVGAPNYCSDCVDSYFKTNSNTCEPCDNVCLTCNQTGTCAECKSGLVLNPTTLQCTSNCSTHNYVDNSSGFPLCKPCDSNCESCSGPNSTNCLSCFNSEYLEGSICVSNCTLGKYPDSNRICRECVYPCITCFGLNTNSCSSCPPNLYLLNKTCVSETACTQNGGRIDSSFCKKCDPTCLTCSGESSTKCLSCSNDKSFFAGKCVSDCPFGYISNPSNKICQSCTPPCETCFSLSQNDCLSCQTPRVLHNSICVNSCPTSTYLNISSNECLSCSGECLTCFNQGDNCLTCMDSELYVHQGKCVSTCPNGFYPSGLKCKSCNEDCGTCDGLARENAGPGAFCLSCKNETIILFNGKCLLECPSGYSLSNYTCQSIPTIAPTRAPTTAPTTSPTQAPTQVPTNSPTDAPTPTSTPTNIPTDETERLHAISKSSEVILFSLLGSFLFLSLLLYCIARYVNKSAMNFTVCILFFSLFDMITDIFFTINAFSESKILGIVSSVFIVLPSLVNISLIVFICFHEIKSNPEFSKWVEKYSWSIPIVILLSSTNTEVFSIFGSRIMKWQVFSSGLNSQTIKKLKLFGLVSVFLEDLPQIVIQSYFAFNFSSSSSVTVTILSITATCIALFQAIFSRILFLFLHFTSKTLIDGVTGLEMKETSKSEIVL